jgi:hypothetical protein
MSVEVNENLGKGSDMARMMALAGIKQDQQAIITQYGFQNPVVGIPEMLNTITDMLALANVKNVGRYFKTPTPQQIQAITSAPKTPDPMAMAAQAQMEKVRSDTAKSVGQQGIDKMRIQTEDAFKHKELQARTAYDFQKLDVEGQKFGVDQHTKLAQMASQLMRDQSDSDAQDQENQQNQAQAQQEGDLKNQQAQNDMAIATQKAAAAHQQGMAKVASQHVQGMAKLMSQHMLGQQQADNEAAVQ